MEESNIQPVHSPVTVCGDIHGEARIHKAASNLSMSNLMRSPFKVNFMICWNCSESVVMFLIRTIYSWYERIFNSCASSCASAYA